MTRLQRLEKALRDDLEAIEKDFDSVMTYIVHADVAWAISQLHRLIHYMDASIDKPLIEGGIEQFGHETRSCFNDSNMEIE